MPKWIWVRDEKTGHEYDVEERALRPGMVPVEGVPVNEGEGARPRPAKHFMGKDGRAAEPGPRTPEELAGLSKPELKAEADARELSVSGTKDELVERIVADDAAKAEEAQPEQPPAQPADTEEQAK